MIGMENNELYHDIREIYIELCYFARIEFEFDFPITIV